MVPHPVSYTHLISNKLHMEGNLIKINKWLYPVSWIYGTGVWPVSYTHLFSLP